MNEFLDVSKLSNSDLDRLFKKAVLEKDYGQVRLLMSEVKKYNESGREVATKKLLKQLGEIQNIIGDEAFFAYMRFAMDVSINDLEDGIQQLPRNTKLAVLGIFTLLVRCSAKHLMTEMQVEFFERTKDALARLSEQQAENN